MFYRKLKPKKRLKDIVSRIRDEESKLREFKTARIYCMEDKNRKT